MENDRFGFVILHYNTINETLDCIESIKKIIKTDHLCIVVVDNCSPNGTGNELKVLFENDDLVDVILLPSNLGFANGNNVGIEFALNEQNCSFVCCINNDTLMIDEHFVDKIIKEYYKNGAAVIGPKIVSKHNKTVMFHHKLGDKEIYIDALEKFKIKLNSLQDDSNIMNTFSKTDFIHKIYYFFKLILFNKRKFNYILQGSCLVFTPVFFTKLKGFCNETFLYREEDILLIDLINNGLYNEYFPKAKIKHLEDVATDSIFCISLEKERFKLQHQINSLEIMIKKMETIKDEEDE